MGAGLSSRKSRPHEGQPRLLRGKPVGRRRRRRGSWPLEGKGPPSSPPQPLKPAHCCVPFSQMALRSPRKAALHRDSNAGMGGSPSAPGGNCLVPLCSSRQTGGSWRGHDCSWHRDWAALLAALWTPAPRALPLSPQGPELRNHLFRLLLSQHLG